MPEPAAPPRLIKFVRRTLRQNPKPTFEEVLARWNASQREQVDPALFQTIYDEELERALQPRPPRDPKHSQMVLVTIAIWILAHLAIALALGLPGYRSCETASSSCGLNLGLVFLSVGLVQLVYGAVAAIIAYRIREPVAQGILIGMSIVVVVFTVLCFATTAVGQG